MILSCVVLTQYSSVTDGRTDASAVAKTRLALHAVAGKNLTWCTRVGYVARRLANTIIFFAVRRKIVFFSKMFDALLTFFYTYMHKIP